MSILTTWLTSDLRSNIIFAVAWTMVTAIAIWAAGIRTPWLARVMKWTIGVVLVDSAVDGVNDIPKAISSGRPLWLLVELAWIAAAVVFLIREHHNRALQRAAAMHRHPCTSEPVPQ